MTDNVDPNKAKYSLKNQSSAVNSTLANHLKEVRTKERYTMRALANILDVPHSFIGKTEREGRRLDVGEFINYCQAMEQDPVDILKAVMAQSQD
jgi:hypothetical protein